jgi:anti-anti-sigma factor
MNIFRREIIREITVFTFVIQSLDATNAAEASACLTEALAHETRVLIDLGSLRYFDIGGFAAILKWAAASPHGPEVRFCSSSRTVHALLELLQADTVVRLYQSRNDALASLRGAELAHRQTA